MPQEFGNKYQVPFWQSLALLQITRRCWICPVFYCHATAQNDSLTIGQVFVFDLSFLLIFPIGVSDINTFDM